MKEETAFDVALSKNYFDCAWLLKKVGVTSISFDPKKESGEEEGEEDEETFLLKTEILQYFWSKKMHSHLCEPLKSSIFTVLVCQKIKRSISKDLFSKMFNYLAEFWPIDQILQAFY